MTRKEEIRQMAKEVREGNGIRSDLYYAILELTEPELAPVLEKAYLNKIIEVIDLNDGNLLTMPATIQAVRALAQEGLHP